VAIVMAGRTAWSAPVPGPAAVGLRGRWSPGRTELTFVTGSGDHVRPSKIRITLPNGGGSRVIAWSSLTLASKTITVDGFRPWLD
jgi:hypothetical protein